MIFNFIISVIFLTAITLPAFSQTDTFIPGQLYLRFTPDAGIHNAEDIRSNPALQPVLNSTPLLDSRPVFPGSAARGGITGMERTFRLFFSTEADLAQIIEKLNGSELIELVEKIPVRQMYGPSNDPLWNLQYQHTLMQLDSAREIHFGDTSVAIAVIDGGVNYLHEDLHSEIWINHAEDVDGDGFLSPADLDSTDADGNGFIDDVIGWDFVHLPGQGYPGEDDSLADNDPMDFGGHGTHCAGDAAAATHNGIGVASPGGNCRIMPVRAGMMAQNGQGYIYYSAEGIYYAANAGAKVISMSYGGSGYSGVAQMAIDYSFSQGVTCVAAAGNDNDTIPKYPASYNHVISVAATDGNDHKAAFSNYGSWVDVSAPGAEIFSTTIGGYGNMSGTSMATPIVAGVAGAVQSMFPAYTPVQVADRVINTTDNIDALNPAYAGRLGSGRVNIYRALDKVIRIYRFSIEDSAGGNANGRLDYGENAGLVLTLKNTFGNAANVQVRVRSLHPMLTISDSLIIFGNMALGNQASNQGAPFTMTVGSDSTVRFLPLDIRVTADNGYEYHKYLELAVGQRDLLIINDDSPSATSKLSYYLEALDSLGRSSYDSWNTAQQGLPGPAEMNYPMIIWYTGEAVQDVLTPEEQQFLKNYLDNGGRLFLSGQNIAESLSLQPSAADFLQNYLHVQFVSGSANDYDLHGVPGDPVGNGEQYIILGSGGANNQNSVDVVTALPPALPAILYDENTAAGQAAVSVNGSFRLVFFAFGWEAINDAGPAKRHLTLQRILNWLQGTTGMETPFGDSPLAEKPQLLPNYPNPFNPQTTIHFYLPERKQVTVGIFNNIGQMVTTLVNGTLAAGHHELIWDGQDINGQPCASGIYYLQLISGETREMQKLVLLR